MRKLLILAYDFPPFFSIGSQRPYNWYKYLGEYEVFPIVVTRQWKIKHFNNLDYVSPGFSNTDIIKKDETGILIQSPYSPNFPNRILLKYGEKRFRLIRKWISGLLEILQFFFLVGPKKEIYFSARNFLKNNKVNAIIATGDPFVLFHYADKLGKEFNIPWIADYRDPWVQEKTAEKPFFVNFFDRIIEKRVLKNAYCISTVSEFFKKLIQNNIKKKETFVLENGFDPEIVEILKSKKQNKTILSIALTGTIYNIHPWQSFLRTCNLFITKNRGLEFQINFLGVNLGNEIKDFVKEVLPNLLPYINISPRMPYEKLIERLAEANVFLLFNHYSISGTKIFDYLALKRKIILCYSNDPEAMELKRKYFHIEEYEGQNQRLQEEIINKTNSGIVVKDSNHLLKVLESLYGEFIEKGEIECPSRDIEQFSRKKQVEKLARIVKEIEYQ